MTDNILGRRAVLNHKLGETDGIMRYTPVMFRNVRFEERIAQRQERRGETGLETFIMFYDPRGSFAENEKGEELTYVPDFVWKNLDEESRKRYFTFSLGDEIFPVLTDAEVKELGIPDTLKRLSSYTVNSVVPCYTSKGLHHLEVSGRGRIFET